MEGGVDPDNRRGMNWGEANSHNPVLKHYKALISARNRSKALQIGEPKLLMADNARGILAYQRSFGNENAIVVINRSTADAKFSLSKLPKGNYRNIFDKAKLNKIGSDARIWLGSRSSAVYLQSGAN
jgi:glycosidase